jgi:formylglycine-generating enzyme required for sulfatase activity
MDEPSHPTAQPARRLADMPVGTVFRDCGGCIEMVRVPAGSFQMGSQGNEAGRLDNEGPVHAVTIGYPLAVSRYPVTRGQWRAFLSDTGRSGSSSSCRGFNQSTGRAEESPGYSWEAPGFPQDDSHPVVCVSWDEAAAYTSWMSWRTRHHYRLLSEAEYEFVNRAGSSSPYFWGNTSDALCRHANGEDAAASARYPEWTQAAGCSDGYMFTSPVGKFEPNGFGLYDTTGNVWSWTQDCYNPGYMGAPANGAAWETGTCFNVRVARGGSWFDSPASLRASSRNWPSGSFCYVGFRLARTD